MKKYITFDSIAYVMSLSTFILILVMLLTACLNLHEKKELQKDVNTMFDHLEKPLAFDGMFLDDSES
jgi:hypothetical protein